MEKFVYFLENINPEHSEVNRELLLESIKTGKWRERLQVLKDEKLPTNVGPIGTAFKYMQKFDPESIRILKENSTGENKVFQIIERPYAHILPNWFPRIYSEENEKWRETAKKYLGNYENSKWHLLPEFDVSPQVIYALKEQGCEGTFVHQDIFKNVPNTPFLVNGSLGSKIMGLPCKSGVKDEIHKFLNGNSGERELTNVLQNEYEQVGNNGVLGVWLDWETPDFSIAGNESFEYLVKTFKQSGLNFELVDKNKTRELKEHLKKNPKRVETEEPSRRVSISIPERNYQKWLFSGRNQRLKSDTDNLISLYEKLKRTKKKDLDKVMPIIQECALYVPVSDSYSSGLYGVSEETISKEVNAEVLAKRKGLKGKPEEVFSEELKKGIAKVKNDKLYFEIKSDPHRYLESVDLSIIAQTLGTGMLNDDEEKILRSYKMLEDVKAALAERRMPSNYEIIMARLEEPLKPFEALVKKYKKELHRLAS
jgi:hypothetical protein